MQEPTWKTFRFRWLLRGDWFLVMLLESSPRTVKFFLMTEHSKKWNKDLMKT